VARVLIFNPAAGYTPRSYFAGEAPGQKGGTTVMAKKHYHKKHHHHYRRNPLGISSGVVQDAVYNAGGALGALYVSNLIPGFGSSGWGSVLATGGAAIAVGYVGRMMSAKAGEEALKGGLTATIIKALHQLGVAQSIGLGLYSPSWFGIPTASDQYLRAAAPGMQFNRGAGSIWFPGPGGQPTLALPAGAVHPAAAAAAGMKGLGFHRFRSRYAGNY